MDMVVHVLRRMGGRATTLLPFSLGLGLLFQDISAAAPSPCRRWRCGCSTSTSRSVSST
jgi:hypothetical protein